jgi:hypothetical protein
MKRALSPNERKKIMRLITFQQPYQTSTSAEAKLGEEAVTPDGRAWKYVKCTHTALSAGFIAVPDASGLYQGTLAAATLTLTANAAGQYVNLAYSTGGLTAGALEDGWLYFYVGTGEGGLFKVKTNSATVIELYPEYTQGVLTATTSVDTSTGAKFWHPFTVTPMLASADQYSIATGIAQIAFAVNDYGWLLTRGYGVVLGTSLVAGHAFGMGGAAAGLALVSTTAKGPYDQFFLGTTAIAANDAAKPNFVFVNMG